MKMLAIHVLFAVAALYDGLLGLVFLLAPSRVFKYFDVPPPNHFGYVQFPAALLIIFGLMFLNIALAPRKHRLLIFYGMLLKIAYCGITFMYWFREGIPWIWKPFTIIDLVMLVLFAWAWKALGTKA